MYDLITIAEALEALPPKPRKPSMRDGVTAIAPQINGALGKAYGVEEVCELLAEHGMTIKPSTLRAYLRALSATTVARASAKPRRKKAKPNQPATPSRVAAPTARGVIRAAGEI